MRYLILYLSSLFVAYFSFAQPDFYGFSKIPLTKTFNTNDYEGGIQNWSISEDRRGFIYVANNFGLLEYDGITWRRYNVPNTTRLRSVYVDADDRIYVGGQNQLGYFFPNANGTLSFTSLHDLLPPETPQVEDIWKVIKYEEKILFCSYQGIIQYDGTKLEWIPRNFEYELAFLVGNTLFCDLPHGGMAQWNGQDFELLPQSDVLRESTIAAILPHKNNGFLIFQKDGQIFQFRQRKFTKWKLESEGFLRNSQINTAVLLKNNNIAIGTQNNGLLILSQEGKALKHLTKGKGLNNRTVLSLHEDSFNNLWVGLNNGITMVELGSPFSLIDEQSGLPGTGYCAVLFEEKLYLGTSNGLFYQKVNPDPISTEADNYQLIKNSSGQVYNAQNINGELYLSHHNGGYTVQNDYAEPFYTGNGVWKFHSLNEPGELLIGTYEGFRLLNDRNSSSRIGNFLESSRVFEFLNDSTLFMTHGYKGVYKITFNGDYTEILDTKFYGEKDGFPSNILINVFNLGNQLVFAAERGIFSYDGSGDSLKHITVLEAQLGDDIHVSELSQDLSGNIYFLSDREMGYLEKTPFGGYKKHSAMFSRIKKFLSDDLENISIIDHQNVFFGAKEGFIHYNPSLEKVYNQPFTTYIRSVSAKTDTAETLYGGAGAILYEEPISLPAYFTSLRFQFAAPYFDGQDELVFQYQLENFDKIWSEWSSVTEKEYTNLSQGDYIFKVRAKNVFGEISEVASFELRVYPPWYRSQIAYIAYACILILVFGLSMFILDIKHKKERAKLTLNQKRELLKKDHEIVEVSKKSEEQISRLRNDKLRAEIDHKNRELATTTMHLINKNEFMLTIRDAIKDSSKNGSKDTFKKIIRDIDRNLSEDEGWEQFTKHFDQVHGEFLNNIKREHPTLTPQEIKLCAYLRMNMTSKEIANLLNISVRGVEISRYRLRKKLDISRDTNLIDYMLEYS
ncbi:MAG: triple tyrosine motif-containing protein [Marinoscillum sp.]